MASINKAALIGYLGADPEIRYATDGTPTATLSVATSEIRTDRKTGAKQKRTEWHRIVVFAGLAETARDFLKKGTQVYVEGPLRTRQWTDKAGIERYSTEIVGRELKLLGKKPADASAPPPHSAQPAAAGDPEGDMPG